MRGKRLFLWTFALGCSLWIALDSHLVAGLLKSLDGVAETSSSSEEDTIPSAQPGRRARPGASKRPPVAPQAPLTRFSAAGEAFVPEVGLPATLGTQPPRKASQPRKAEKPQEPGQEAAPPATRDPKEVVNELFRLYAQQSWQGLLNLVSPHFRGYGLDQLRFMALTQADFEKLEWIQFRAHVLAVRPERGEDVLRKVAASWDRAVKLASGEVWELDDQRAVFTLSNDGVLGWRLLEMEEDRPFPVSAESDGSFEINKGHLDHKPADPKRPRKVRGGVLLPPGAR